MLLKLKSARQRIEELRLALMGPSPQEIGAVLPGLEEAVLCLQAVEQAVREGGCADFAIHRELRLLKNELRISARLVEQGVAFCHCWAKMLGLGPAYTQTGQPAPSESGGTLSLCG